MALADTTLPEASVTYADAGEDVVYTVSELPAGLIFTADSRVLNGTPRVVGAYVITYTATQTRSGPDADDTDDDVEVSDSITFTINVLSEARDVDMPTFDNTVSDFTFVNSQMNVLITLPAASGGMAPIMYAATGLPSGWTFEPVSRHLFRAGQLVLNATGTEVTYTATDANELVAMLTFTITVNVDSMPMLAVTEDETFEVGVFNSVMLGVASDGDEPLTYEMTDLPDGLTWAGGSVFGVATGTPGMFEITYTVTDADGDEASDMFTITVQAQDAG